MGDEQRERHPYQMSAAMTIAGVVVIVIALSIFGTDPPPEDTEPSVQQALVSVEAPKSAPEPEPEQLQVADPVTEQKEASEPTTNSIKLTEATVETLDLFRELYEFRNDAEFHRVGFAIAYRYNGWLVKMEHLAERHLDESLVIMSEIGIVPGDLHTLAQDYIDNGGCPLDSFSEGLYKTCFGLPSSEPRHRVVFPLTHREPLASGRPLGDFSEGSTRSRPFRSSARRPRSAHQARQRGDRQ